MNPVNRNTQTRILASSLFELYAKDYGEIKAKKLINSIEEASDKIKAFLQFWEAKGIVPNQRDLQKVIGSVNWFVFSKRETMTIACLILLTKWEKEVNFKLENEVLQIGLSIIEYYKVYELETHNIIKSLPSIEDISTLSDKKLNQLVGKTIECIKNGLELHITGIRCCLIIPKEGRSETIESIKCEVFLLLKERGRFNINLFKFLPENIANTFPVYNTEEDVIYKGEFICFTVSNISLKSDSEITLTLTTRNKFVDPLEGDIISIRNIEETMTMHCHISDEGIFLSSDEHGWYILLEGTVEEWVYDYE